MTHEIAMKPGWSVIEEAIDARYPDLPVRVHVVPDGGEHVITGIGCWCGPVVTYECPGCGDRVLTHRVISA